MTSKLEDNGPPLIRRSVVSASISPEVNNLKEDLEKLLIVSITRGFISQSSLQAELEKMFIDQALGKLSCFRGDSFVISLDSSAEVERACKLKEVELSSSSGRCWVSFEQWSGDIGSEGAARGSGIWVNLWNLPLHCWTSQVVAKS